MCLLWRKVTQRPTRQIAKLDREHQKNLAALAEKQGKVTPADVRREIGLPEKPRRVLEPPAPQETVSHAAAPDLQPNPKTNGNDHSNGHPGDGTVPVKQYILDLADVIILAIHNKDGSVKLSEEIPKYLKARHLL